MSVADAAAPKEPGGGIVGWIKGHVPTREGIARNRWLRPVAHHILKPDLWRFNRRSVPRAAAVGAVCTVLFPVAHMPAAAIASVPARANVPLAIGITVPGLLVFPGLLYLAKRIGSFILHIDRTVPGQPIATNVHAHHGFLAWLAQNGPAAIVGLLVLAPIVAAVCYGLAAWLWRLRVARRWRNRRKRKGN